jgi:hypothetical protein
MGSTTPLTKAQVKIHNKMLMDLLATREKLLGIDPESLDADHLCEWNDQVFQVSLAIVAAQRPILLSISTTDALQLPAMQQAISELNRNAARLDRADDVIAAVGAGLNSITSVVKLLS